MKLISSIQELKQTAEYIDNAGFKEYYIVSPGTTRNFKRIAYFSDTNTFDVYHETDDTFAENLSEEELKTETMIVDAIEKKALFLYEF